jgi:Tfp pilus assembly protein FimT
VKSHMGLRTARGFSLIELVGVMSIGLLVSAMAVMSLQPTLKFSRVNNAYNLTLATLRQARDRSVSQRQTYFVTFSSAASPNSITITNGGTGTVVNTYLLPQDVTFAVVAGVPTAANATPDGFGTGGTAIDFDQGIAGGNKSVIYFMPDGSAQDVAGNLNNGVIYIARAGELYSSHAITVWGATGRLRGWRLYSNAGTPYWRQN